MRAKRIDANQNKIVEELRRAGFSVAITSMVGNGFPDLVVSNYASTILVEIKDGDKPPSQRKLTKDEQAFIDSWKGCVIVAHDTETIINCLRHKTLKVKG